MATDDEIKNAITNAKNILSDEGGNPTPNYETYLKYKEAYKNKTKEFNAEYEKALTDPVKLQMWPLKGKIFQDEVDEAFNKLQSLGFKYEIENALNILSAQRIDPSKI